MANGTTEDKLHEVWAVIDDVRLNGCAKREGDLKQIQSLEKSVDSLGKKLDRIFFVSLGTLAAMCAFLLKYVLFK